MGSERSSHMVFRSTDFHKFVSDNADLLHRGSYACDAERIQRAGEILAMNNSNILPPSDESIGASIKQLLLSLTSELVRCQESPVFPIFQSSELGGELGF